MLTPLTPDEQQELDTVGAVVQAASDLVRALSAVPYVEALEAFERLRAQGKLRFDAEQYPMGTPIDARTQVPMSAAEADSILRLLRPIAVAQQTFRSYPPDGHARVVTDRRGRPSGHRGARRGRRGVGR